MPKDFIFACMNKTVKAFASIIAIAVAIFVVYGAMKAIEGNYLKNASFITSLLLLCGVVFGLYIIVKFIKTIWLSGLVAFVFIVQSCNYAKSNQQVLVSTDCGMQWKKIEAGDAVPKGVGNPCFMKVVIPNFPMQGDSRFITNLKDRVRAAVQIDYDYSIIDPLAFIMQAKYLGKANSDADSDGALNPSAFEGAENMVIDKRLRDVSKAMFLNEDIVELDQADLENELMNKTNDILAPLGVHLNFITLTFDLDEQTRQAIDISTAMKVYESKNLTELGKQVMVSRAGATKIYVENKALPAEKTD